MEFYWSFYWSADKKKLMIKIIILSISLSRKKNKFFFSIFRNFYFLSPYHLISLWLPGQLNLLKNGIVITNLAMGRAADSRLLLLARAQNCWLPEMDTFYHVSDKKMIRTLLNSEFIFSSRKWWLGFIWIRESERRPVLWEDRNLNTLEKLYGIWRSLVIVITDSDKG